MGNDLFLIFMNYFVPFPLFVIGMSFGVQGCMIALGVFFTMLFMVAGAGSASLYLVLYGLPAVALVHQALSKTIHPDRSISWPSFGKVLEMMIGIGIVGFILLSLFLAQDEMGPFQQSLQESLQEFFPQITPLQIETFLLFLPGMIVLGWCFLLLGNEILAQKLVSYFNYNLRPDFHLDDIVCPHWILYLFLASTAGGLLFSGMIGFIAKNIALISGLGLFLNGLSLIHRVIKTSAHSAWFFTLFYILFILSIWIVLVVIGFGIAETVLRLKDRLTLPKGV